MVKTADSRLDSASLVCPEVFYWPGYMWVLNDEMSETVMSDQLTYMAAQGARTVTPLPEPREFRPTTMPTLMSPDYLSTDYMDRFRHILAEVRRLGMNFWLYDEGGWPSGAVCGKLVKENPELGAKTLNAEQVRVARGDTISIPPDCLAAFLCQGSESPRRLAPGATLTINSDNSRILVVTVTSSDWLPDLLSPKSTEEFIRLTHDAYRRAIGNEFGKTVTVLFTDEPWVSLNPWTDDFADGFLRSKGYDLMDKLPSIFEGDTAEDKQARIDYWDWWSRRYADAFFGRIRDWCRENDILFGGHLGGENSTACVYEGGGIGHPLRDLRSMDVPGVDTIWRQLWPGTTTHHWPKYASSAAHFNGTPWAMSESFAVYGAGLTHEQMKWISDYQSVRGINLFTIIGYPLSNKDWFVGGQRPTFCPDNPLFKFSIDYNTYLARLNYLLSLGEPVITTALYYPMRDVWVGGPDCHSAASSHDALARALLENQCDFDLVDDDVLEEALTLPGGKLQVGKMVYDTVCVGSQSWMTAASRERLSEFAAGGGKLLWVDNAEGSHPTGALAADTGSLHSFAKPLVTVTPECDKLRVCCRKLSNGRLYFITNEDSDCINCSVEFCESLPPVVIDAESGKCYRSSEAKNSSDGWSMPVNLPFAGSLLVLFTSDDLPLVPEPAEAGRTLLTLNDGWTCRRARTYTIGDHEIEVRESEDAGVPVSLGDWRSILGEGFSGDGEYELAFDCPSGVAQDATHLDLGSVKYACEVEVNGQALGRRSWQPFSFPVAGVLMPGANTIKVTVTNTLANQYCTSSALDRWTPTQLGPYHPKALQFEPDSLPSGLYGPVVIRAGAALIP